MVVSFETKLLDAPDIPQLQPFSFKQMANAWDGLITTVRQSVGFRSIVWDEHFPIKERGKKKNAGAR